MANVTPLHNRHRAYLQAAADGRAEMTASREPDLYVDGLAVADQFSAHQLADAGYLTPHIAGAPGQRVPAELTDHGTSALTA